MASAAPCGDVWTCPEICDIDNVRYDCGKYVMCGGFIGEERAYCACEGCGCAASTTAGQLSFDLQLEDNGEITGSVEVNDREAGSHLIYLSPVTN